MARRIPESRFEELVVAATEVFIERGYRLSQMADVAVALGVAKGTLYTYVESKEALLGRCLNYADRAEPIPIPSQLPVPTPMPGDLTQILVSRLEEAGTFPILTAALATRRANDPRAELRAVLAEQYDVQESHRCAIGLVECAIDHKEIGPLWQGAAREGTRRELARYIEQRASEGQLLPQANAALAARLVVEVIATWAMHIHRDPYPERFDPGEAREHAIAFLLRGLLPDGGSNE